jgi:hypothetical protein
MFLYLIDIILDNDDETAVCCCGCNIHYPIASMADCRGNGKNHCLEINGKKSLVYKNLKSKNDSTCTNAQWLCKLCL